MQIVIAIPEETHERIKDYYKTHETVEAIYSYIVHGTVLPEHGHWIEIEQYSDGKHKIECSECGNHIFDRGHANSHNVKERYKFCPMCGVKMSE